LFSFDLDHDTIIDADWRPALDQIASITASDEHTVTFTFTRVFPEQFYTATYYVRMLPAHLLDTIPRGRLEEHPLIREPVGSGPFRFRRWLTATTPELVANPDYHLGTPGLARVMWTQVADNNTALSMVLAGDGDVLEVVQGLEAQERARNSNNVTLYPYVFPYYYYGAFNFRDREDRTRPHWLFSDPAVRRAITMAIDRQSIARAVFGEGGEAPPGPVSRMLAIWTDSLPRIPYDTVGAIKLLRASGWSRDDDGVFVKNGRPLEFEISYPATSGARHQAAVFMQEQLRAVGIVVTLRAGEPMEQNARAEQGDFDVTLGAWLNDPSPSGMRSTWTTGTTDNHGKYSNPEFDRLVHEAIYASTADEARRYWDQALRTIIDDAPALWLMSGPFPAAVSSRFENVTIRPVQWAADLWRWRVRPGMLLPRDRVSIQ
jgi:peptide/nickel transport system substrate-binding protein